MIPPNFRPLALDVGQEDAFVVEFSRIYLQLTVQEMLIVLETDRTASGKANHRVG